MKKRELTKTERYDLFLYLTEYYELPIKIANSMLKDCIFPREVMWDKMKEFQEKDRNFLIPDWIAEIDSNKHYFNDAKVSDRVWHRDRGWGTITELNYSFDIDNFRYLYLPLVVRFDDGDGGVLFDLDGGFVSLETAGRGQNVKSQELFWNEYVVPINAHLKVS